MKRELKFRAWCRDGEFEEDGEKRKFEMISADDLGLFDSSGTLAEGLQDMEDEIYFMQYTGLKDKNGVEIYDGDIVKILKDHTKAGKDILIKGVVSFMDASFYIKTSYGGHYRWMDYKIEIIGNIHQNPELLK